MSTGRIDLSRLDTTPGGRGPFAPPDGWNAAAGACLALMRERYRSDCGAAPQILDAAHRLSVARLEGPWADNARRIAEQVHAHLRRGRTRRRAA